MPTDLLLVGAGHAHLHVVRRAEQLRAAGYRVQLLSPRYFHYSGVASATAAGSLPADAGRIDVRSLARASGVDFHEGTLASLDLEGRVATTARGAQLPYRVLSLNIGSVVSTHAMRVDPDVVRVKPLCGLADLDARIRSVHGLPGATVTVVGGGATGLEMAAHLSARDDVALVRLVESGPRVGPDLPSRARLRAERLLAERGVDIHTGCSVTTLGAEQLTCEDGRTLSHDVALLATGLVAPPVLLEVGLGDEMGVPIDATLQHIGRGEIYAVGDCALFTPSPLPRIGVHGVRQGPVLHRSLLARMTGDPRPVYQPPGRALAILDLGDGIGLAVRGRWWWYGGAALRLKRVVDRRWLNKYQT